MKKYAKLISLVLVIITFCTILCSCDALDEMRASQGFWWKDGTIHYDGNTYVKLPVYTELNSSAYGYDSSIFITEKNVPVLLSQEFGSYRNITKDGVVIDGNGELYALAGKYAQVVKEAEKVVRGEFDKYTIEYYDNYDTEMEITCTSHDVGVIKSIINDENIIDFDSGSMKRSIHIYCSSDNGYFGHYYGSIHLLKDGEYVVEENQKHYGQSIYLVPEKYQKDIEDIFSRCVDSIIE